jgi:hypothetical protein
MVYISNIGTAPDGQTLTVNWRPVDGDLGITSTGTSFAGAPASGTVPGGNNGTGTISYTITPPAIQAAELSSNPFLEKTSQLEFTVTKDGSDETKSVTLRQIAYNLVPGNVDGVLDTSPQNQTINVRSNFDWTITAVADGDDILQNEGALEGTTRNANTGAGNPLTVTLQPEASNGSKNGKTATITFTSLIDGSTWDITITATDALYVGMFGGALTRTGNEWQFPNKLYIQAKDQSSGLRWGPTNDKTDVTDYWDGKGNTLALYQLSSTKYPAAKACFEKNSGYASITGETDANYVWYLPAQRQLMAAWVSYYSFDDAKPLSAFYRSATEDDASAAWVVYFVNGGTNYNDGPKASSLPVRCVREGN